MPKIILSPAEAVKAASAPAPQPESLASEFAPKIAEPKPPVSSIPPAGFENPPVEEPASAPAVATEAPASEVTFPAQESPGTTRFVFVKNINPHEKITFLDGSTFRFTKASLVTTDSALASKIIAVSEKYRIVVQ